MRELPDGLLKIKTLVKIMRRNLLSLFAVLPGIRPFSGNPHELLIRKEIGRFNPLKRANRRILYTSITPLG